MQNCVYWITRWNCINIHNLISHQTSKEFSAHVKQISKLLWFIFQELHPCEVSVKMYCTENYFILCLSPQDTMGQAKYEVIFFGIFLKKHRILTCLWTSICLKENLLVNLSKNVYLYYPFYLSCFEISYKQAKKRYFKVKLC